MYQVKINDKFYISEVDGFFTYNGDCTLLEFQATEKKENGKMFDNKVTAYDIAKQVGGKVIEYIELRQTEIEVNWGNSNFKFER